MSMQPTWPTISAMIQSFALAQGVMPVAVVIKHTTGILELPIVAVPTAKKRKKFVPTAFQEAILEALEGKALRTDALAAKVGDRRALFRKPRGGLDELIKEGLVEHHERLGYFRSDAPPPELAGERN